MNNSLISVFCISCKPFFVILLSSFFAYFIGEYYMYKTGKYYADIAQLRYDAYAVSAIAFSSSLILPTIRHLKRSFTDVHFGKSYTTATLVGTLPIIYILYTRSSNHNNIDVSIIFIFSICFIAPVLEELFFRGYVHHKMSTYRVPYTTASFATAVLFLIAHYPFSFSGFLFYSILSLSLSTARYYAGNVYFPAALHIFVNIFSIVVGP